MTTSGPTESYISNSDQITREIYDEARWQAELGETLYDLRAIPAGMSLGILAVEHPWQDRSEAQEFLFWHAGQDAPHEWLQYTEKGLMPAQMLGSALFDGAIFERDVLKQHMSFYFNVLDNITFEDRTYPTMLIRQTGPVLDYALRATLEPYPL